MLVSFITFWPSNETSKIYLYKQRILQWYINRLYNVIDNSETVEKIIQMTYTKGLSKLILVQKYYKIINTDCKLYFQGKFKDLWKVSWCNLKLKKGRL